MDHNQNSISTLLGKQLPYSIENEQALLGALILDSEKIGDVSAVLTSDDFYIDKHQKIYEAQTGLQEVTEP